MERNAAALAGFFGGKWMGMGRVALGCGWLFWGSVLAVGWGGGEAWGQAGGRASGRATVYQVPAPGEAGRFQVPQVRLTDAAVARRINRLLLQVALDDDDAKNANVSPQRRIWRAARACCYDAETRTWAAAGGGLTGSWYAVTLNGRGLLSLRIIRQSTGAHHNFDTTFLTFDLRTGRQLALADLVADPPAQLVRRMQGAINRRYREALAETVETVETGDSAVLAEMTEHFYWDWAAQRVRWFAGDTADLVAGTAPDPDVETFALTPTALLLFHSANFHRLSQANQPDETYRFPYARLQVRPLLRPLLPATRPAARPALPRKPRLPH